MKNELSEIPVIPYGQLGGILMSEVSFEGIAVSELPSANICTRLNVQVRNHSRYRSGYDTEKIFYIFADVEFETPSSDHEALLKRIDIAFPKFLKDHSRGDGFPIYRQFIHQFDERFIVTIEVDLDVSNRPSIAVREALSPLIASLGRMTMEPPIVFICHASEDKSSARAIAEDLKQMGVIVWLDEWEIKVGDSIVEKVNRGLRRSSHLILLLSAHSVDKPWVQRELSAALMRQLSDRQIRVLPVKLDACVPPTIIADLKYVDATGSLSNAVKLLKEALFQL